MYHKVKNTLVGLGVVAAMILGGALVSEPVPAKTIGPSLALEAHQARIAAAIVEAAISIALAEGSEKSNDELSVDPAAVGHSDAQQAVEQDRKAKSSSRLRLELGMPYYSFGAMLPRRRES